MAEKANEKEDKSIEYNGETVNYTSQIVEPIKQTFTELNEKSKQFISYWAGEIDDLFSLAGIEANTQSYTAKELDELLDVWNNRRTVFGEFEEEQFVSSVGSAFGNFLNKTFDTEWMVLTDEYGSDYCCTSKHRGGNESYQLFPFSSVWKAIDEKREKSLEAIIAVVMSNINEGKE